MCPSEGQTDQCAQGTKAMTCPKKRARARTRPAKREKEPKGDSTPEPAKANRLRKYGQRTEKPKRVFLSESRISPKNPAFLSLRSKSSDNLVTKACSTPAEPSASAVPSRFEGKRLCDAFRWQQSVLALPLFGEGRSKPPRSFYKFCAPAGPLI